MLIPHSTMKNIFLNQNDQVKVLIGVYIDNHGTTRLSHTWYASKLKYTEHVITDDCTTAAKGGTQGYGIRSYLHPCVLNKAVARNNVS